MIQRKDLTDLRREAFVRRSLVALNDSSPTGDFKVCCSPCPASARYFALGGGPDATEQGRLTTIDGIGELVGCIAWFGDYSVDVVPAA